MLYAYLLEIAIFDFNSEPTIVVICLVINYIITYPFANLNLTALLLLSSQLPGTNWYNVTTNHHIQMICFT